MCRGAVLRGAGAGDATNLVWAGAEDSVMLDMPGPSGVRVEDINFDGNNTPGVIGLRYRSGWEFGNNGGKDNIFERLSFIRLDVGISIGDDMLSPDLVASSFRHVRIDGGVSVGFRAIGGNVAGMYYEDIMAECEKATWRLRTVSFRLIRPRSEAGSPPPKGGELMRNAAGGEIFLEQMPRFWLAHTAIRRNGQVYAGGGEPTVSIRNVVSSVDFCDAWLVESDSAPVRIQGVRMEGCGGLYRNHDIAGNSAEAEMQSPRRFSDILIDVSAHSNGGGLDDAVIDYANVGPLYIVGGSLGGSIKLAPRSQVFSIGSYFESDHSNAVMRGMAD